MFHHRWTSLSSSILLGLLLSSSPRADGADSATPIAEPNYRAEVQRFVPVPLAGKRPNYADRIERGPLRRFSEETAVVARLWKWTARPEYAEDARQRLSALVDVWQMQQQPGRPWKRVCFFSAYPIMDAYRILAAGDQLDADFQQRFKQFARVAYYPLEDGIFNQGFARAAGLALAAQTLPDVPEARVWRAAAEDVWTRWNRQHDTTENAACYNGISLTFLFLLGDALGKTDELKDPAVRQMFERFRDQISPHGFMPEYGDSGDARWAMLHCWGNWVCSMERAGSTYRDPTFRAAAVGMFKAAGRPPAEDADEEMLDAMNTAYALCLAEEWRDRQLHPRPIEAASSVSYRREPGNDHAPDKLTLAPSRRDGSPFAMSELFARSYHAHEDQLGALLYYEVGGVPLLHGLGYHNREAGEANLVLMRPPDEPFPFGHPPAAAGVWHEASLPLKRLPAVRGESGSQPNLRHFDKLTFRVSEDGPVDLSLANLRLVGPKGELSLDDFQRTGCWHSGRQAIVPGPTPEQPALRISCQRGTCFIWRAGFNMTVSLADYDRIKFSWMMRGHKQGWSRSLLLRVDESPNDFHVAIRPQAANIVDARVDAHGGDQFGQFTADSWFTEDTRLVRRMVLLAEGPLVVVDELTPGRQADGWVAGPLWHLRSKPPQGGNWFDAPGHPNLMVWFAPAADRTPGMQTTSLWSGVQPYTVFAKQTLRAGQPVRFTSVLVPHPASTRPEIRTDETASPGVRLDLELPTGRVHVEIDGDGKWAVRR